MYKPLWTSAPVESTNAYDTSASCVEGLARAIPVVVASVVSVAATISTYIVPCCVVGESANPASETSLPSGADRTIATPAGITVPGFGEIRTWFIASEELDRDVV